ncbi:hypothetical protein D918_07442 [Trichuris suis]|nr:hypothetical protein D918_07442 [Trichuris suis]
MRGVYVRSLIDSPNPMARRLKFVFSPKIGANEDTTTDGGSEASESSCDGFVVPDNFVEYEEQPEPIESNLEKPENAHSTKRIDRKSVVRKKRRVFICETSDSDETGEVPRCNILLPKPTEFKPTPSESAVGKALTNEPVSFGQTHEVLPTANVSPCGSSSIRPEETLPSSSVMKPLVLIGLHQICSAQHIASTFRTSFGINVYVCSLVDCDYVLSNRMVCKRVFYSEFSNPTTNGKIRKGVFSLLSSFSCVVLLLERDRLKNKFYSKEIVPPQELHHNKVVDSALAVLFLEPRVKVVFADSVDDSAEILAQLTQSEARRGYGIQWDPNFSHQELQMLKFYRSFACTTYLSSFNLVKNFGSVEAVMRSSISDLMSKGKMLRHQAELFYHFIHEKIDADARFWVS